MTLALSTGASSSNTACSSWASRPSGRSPTNSVQSCSPVLQPSGQGGRGGSREKWGGGCEEGRMPSGRSPTNRVQSCSPVLWKGGAREKGGGGAVGRGFGCEGGANEQHAVLLASATIARASRVQRSGTGGWVGAVGRGGGCEGGRQQTVCSPAPHGERKRRGGAAKEGAVRRGFARKGGRQRTGCSPAHQFCGRGREREVGGGGC